MLKFFALKLGFVDVLIFEVRLVGLLVRLVSVWLRVILISLFVNDFLFEGFLDKRACTVLVRCALCFSLSCLIKSSKDTSAIVWVLVLITEVNDLKNIWNLYILTKAPYISFKQIKKLTSFSCMPLLILYPFLVQTSLCLFLVSSFLKLVFDLFVLVLHEVACIHYSVVPFINTLSLFFVILKFALVEVILFWFPDSVSV